MSVYGIEGYTSNYSLSSFTSQEQTAASTSAGAGKRAQSAYGSSISSGAGQAAVKKALGEIEPNANGRITFDMISDHREKLEGEFSVLLAGGLMLDGVDPNVEFSLVAGSDGSISVRCDDAVEKEKIEKFLQENPKVGEQFLYIQALGNLERAQSGSAAVRNWEYMKNTKMELQSQAIEMFFSAAQAGGLGFASLMGEFGGEANAEGGNFFMGTDYMV